MSDILPLPMDKRNDPRGAGHQPGKGTSRPDGIAATLICRIWKLPVGWVVCDFLNTIDPRHPEEFGTADEASAWALANDYAEIIWEE